MDDADFKEMCLDPGRLRPIPTLTERKREAENARGIADKRMAAARHLLGSSAEQMAVGMAALAMEAKSNGLLAVAGWRSKSHVCTQAALSKLLERKDLAARLSRAYEDRQVFDYTNDPEVMRSAPSTHEFVAMAEAYLGHVDRAIRARPL
jgi:uncharacterized protein (UPF0332 family)